jgi:hypothetical protein
MPNYKPTKAAAAEVHLSPSFLYRHSKEIPAARRAGRALRWDVNALKAWMRQQAMGTPDDTMGKCAS